MVQNKIQSFVGLKSLLIVGLVVFVFCSLMAQNERLPLSVRCIETYDHDQRHQHSNPIHFTLSQVMDQLSDKIVLDRPVSNLLISFENIRFISSERLENTELVELRLSAVTEEGQEAIAVYIGSGHIPQSDDGSVIITKDNLRKMEFFFSEKIDAIDIHIKKVNLDQKFSAYISTSDIVSICKMPDAQIITPTNEDCRDKNVLLALDISSSITKEERKLIKDGILYWYTVLDNKGNTPNIGLLSYSSDIQDVLDASLDLPIEHLEAWLEHYVNDMEIEPNGSWTSWSVPLKQAITEPNENRYDHVLLISDDVPNGTTHEKSGIKEEVSSILEIKEKMTRLGLTTSILGLGEWDPKQVEAMAPIVCSIDSESQEFIFDAGIKNSVDFNSKFQKQMSLICEQYDISNKEHKGIIAYPNPAKDRLFINLKNLFLDSQDGEIHIQLVHPNGQLCQNATFNSHQELIELDIRKLTPSVYTLRIFSEGNELFTEKVVLL